MEHERHAGAVAPHGAARWRRWLAVGVLALAGCRSQPPADAEAVSRGTSDTPAAADEYHDARASMVREQLRGRDIEDERVLRAMQRVPRHAFVPAALRPFAYADRPLPIGHEATISQPYIVAYMTQAAEVEPGERVLEVGTGSGYQAAVLAELGADVYTIEIVLELAARARATLASLGYDRVRVRTGDGYAGWPEAAPFDAILVTAAPDHVPPALVEQLAVGGRLVIPVGTLVQQLLVITKDERGASERRTIPVRFVPLLRDPGADSPRR